MKWLTRKLGRRQVIERASVEIGASPSEVAAVEDALARSGFSVHVTAEVPMSGGPPVEAGWIVYVTLGVPITAFFGKLGAAAGEDVYAAMRDWVSRVRAARREAASPGEIHIHAGDGSLIIPADDEAVAALQWVDIGPSDSGYVRWDRERHAWQIWDDGRDDWRDLPRRDRAASG